MNDLLNHLEIWKESKNKIFDYENYEVFITIASDNSKKFQYIDLHTNKLVARAKLWETGELELEALDMKTKKRVI